MKNNLTARVYAPKPNSFAAQTVAPGSGVVGFDPDEEGQITIYFEGNLNDACNLHSFHDRIKNAAGRLFKSYPTSALARVDATDLIEIGKVDRYYHISITNPAEAGRIEGEYKKVLVGKNNKM